MCKRSRSPLTSDVTAENCKAVETTITKYSKLLRGHDQAAPPPADILEPVALKAEIDTPTDWLAAIRKGRAKSAEVAFP